MKKTFSFTAISRVTMEHETGAKKSLVQSNDLRLEVSNNLDRSIYLDGKGLPRKEALKPISSALVTGLITNMRMGAAKGWWKEGEHMQWVIDTLQRGFVTQGEAKEATW